MKDYLSLINTTLDAIFETTIEIDVGDRIAAGKFRNRPGVITKVDDNDGKPEVTIKLDDSLTKKGRRKKGKTKKVNALPFKKLKDGDKGFEQRTDLPSEK